MRCIFCADTGWVCENHPRRPWEGPHRHEYPLDLPPNSTRRAGGREAVRVELPRDQVFCKRVPSDVPTPAAWCWPVSTLNGLI